MRLKTDIKPKEATFQVVLNVLALTPFYRAFLITADVPAIYMQEFWAIISVHKSSIRFTTNKKKVSLDVDMFREILQFYPKIPGQKFEDLPLELDILSFIRDLGHTGNITYLIDVNVDYLHQPWRAFATVINKCLSGKETGMDKIHLSHLLFQIENKDAKKTNMMSYPRFIKIIIDYFMSKDLSISRRNKMFWHTARDDTMLTSMRCISRHEDTQVYGTILPKELTNQAMLESNAYKTYYIFASGEKAPKPKYARKKADPDTSPKQKPVEATKGTRLKSKAKVAKSDKKKQPTKKPKAKGLSVLFEVALTEDEQLKLATKRSKTQFHSSHASGSGDGVDTQSKVPDEQQQNEKESWGESEDEDEDEDEDDDNDYDDLSDEGDDDNDDNDGNDGDDDDANDDDKHKGTVKSEAHAEKNAYIELIDTSMRALFKEEVNTQLPQILPQAVSDFAKSVIEKNVTGISRSCSLDKKLYDALVESYNTGKDVFDSYGKVFSLKSSRDEDKYRDPSTGSDRGKKRRKSSRCCLKIPNLTQEILVRPAFNLVKGTCKSIMELEYHLEECSKVKTERLDWHNLKNKLYPFDLRKPLPLIQDHRGRQIIPKDYFINKDLEYLKGGDLSRRYSTSVKFDQHAYLGTSHWGPKRQSFYGYASNLTSSKDVYSRRRIIALYTFKEGDFKRLCLQDIEDMLLLLIQQNLTNLIIDEWYDLNVALRMYTRRIVIQRRVEDLQLGVESYQKKLNLTKPDTYRLNLRNKTAYTSHSDPHGIVYVDQFKRKRLMRADELHKFSDGTLNDVRTTLHDIAAGIRMEYLLMRKWSKLDKKRARVMVQHIGKQLYQRRLMRNLEKFVSGRDTGMISGYWKGQYDFVIFCLNSFQVNFSYIIIL
ncbi:hypothetical protein Tco_0697487 [Tanacetum coccineum]